MLVKNSPPKKGIFITGTDTGVGKTYVARLLARALSSGRHVAVFKPYLTGSRSDARALLRAARSGQTLDDVNLYFFKKPLAPLLAARLEKKRISVGRTLAAFK
ncbi:MAG: dethiobiotin synthase, partial [Endomicrobiia bacterium]|nr:dethiobiotin synthase [Endomicrobiia bacterium]